MRAMLHNLMEKWRLIYNRIRTVFNDGNVSCTTSFIIIIITIEMLEILSCLMLTLNFDTFHSLDGFQLQMPSAV